MIENIISEYYEVVQQFGIDCYILMGYLIIGFYGVFYVNMYLDEVFVFVGIDSSVFN